MERGREAYVGLNTMKRQAEVRVMEHSLLPTDLLGEMEYRYTSYVINLKSNGV